MTNALDLVITWPKTKPLADYLAECERAAQQGLLINYRVARPPAERVRGRLRHCYVVYDGQVRGYQTIVAVTHRPAGWYIARDPRWYAIEPTPMRGFQGWRFYRGAGNVTILQEGHVGASAPHSGGTAIGVIKSALGCSPAKAQRVLNALHDAGYEVTRRIGEPVCSCGHPRRHHDMGAGRCYGLGCECAGVR